METPEQFRRIEMLFDGALARPASERAEFLRRACLDQFESRPAALASVVLEIVRLVEDEPGPGVNEQRVHVSFEDVVVDDHPASESWLGRVIRPHDGNLSLGVHRLDLSRPVTLD